MKMHFFIVVCTVAGLISLQPGCSSGSGSASTVAAGENSLQSGLDAFDKGDYAAAETALNTAISSGSLQADLVETAIRTLAQSRIQLGKTDEAAADLEKLKAGASELDKYWLVVAELEKKKGNAAAVTDAIKQAKAANPKVQVPPSLLK
jgi:lipopolysaccharide biosynthesis regulator YciM